jgi:hypothetical protein
MFPKSPAIPAHRVPARKEQFSAMINRLLILLLVSASWAVAQEPATKPTYQTLLERVKKNDHAVDFKELRLAYTDTPEYSPYGGDAESRKHMFEALNAK